MKKLHVVAFLLLSAPLLRADAEEGRVKTLEKEVADLKAMVKDLKEQVDSSKEAWFDLDEVFAKSAEYQDELDRVEKDLKSRENDLMTLKKEYDAAVTKLQNAGSTMKEDARERTVERITELEQKMKTKQRMLEQKLQQERYAVQAKIMEKIYDAAASVAQEEGWAKANPMVPKKLVFSKNGDITASVCNKINKNYKPKKQESKKEDSKAVAPAAA